MNPNSFNNQQGGPQPYPPQNQGRGGQSYGPQQVSQDDFVLTLPGVADEMDAYEQLRDDQSAQWPNINSSDRPIIPMSPVHASTPMPAASPLTPPPPAPTAQYATLNQQPHQAEIPVPVPVAVAAVEKRRNTVLKMFGLLAIVLALIGAMIVTLILVPRFIGFVSNFSFNIFGGDETETIVTADRTRIASGEIALLTWNGPVRMTGVYSLTVPCKDGIVAAFHTGEQISCDQPFFFTSADNTVAYRLYNTSGSEQSIPAYINYKNEEEDESIIGDTFVNVTHGVGAPATGTPVTPSEPTTPVVVTPPSTPTTPTTPSKPTTPTSQTIADLTLTLTDIGWLDDNNVFRSGSNAPANAKSAIKFTVRNIGSRASGAWSFTAQLPSAANPNYQSPVQNSIGAGGSSEFTLGFDTAGTPRPVVIGVNNNRAVNERSYANNTLVVENYRTGSTGSTGNTGTTQPTTFGSDLQVQITSVGRMVNSQFQATASVSKNDTGAIQFLVRNNGSVATGAWKFTANLPAANSANRTYTSVDQGSLAPGAAVSFTLSFFGFDSTGTRQITITADSQNQVIESNESNNSTSAGVVVGN